MSLLGMLRDPVDDKQKTALKAAFFLKNILFTFGPRLYCTLDLAAPKTPGAHQNLFGAAINDGPDALQVW